MGSAQRDPLPRRGLADDLQGHHLCGGPRLVLEPVTESVARHAAALLAGAGLDGHRRAIDAMLGATAFASPGPGPGPVTILTPDPENLIALCGGRVTAIKV